MDSNLLCDLFGAYFDARRNKRHTINALSFEVDYETKLFGLYEDIKNGEYCINPSVCFISFSPVQREIFAADFRDRIVHHLIYNYISPLFERLFIGDSYSCRVGKGTSRGVERLGHFIRSCSHNYQKDCYVLKLDIMGYFMAIDHFVLYQKVERVINRFRYDVYFDVDLVLRLIRQVIFHDHVKNCRIKGKIKDWSGLPKSKSLFWAEKNKGLPIGNLTSQLFGNVYLNDFDHFVKRKLRCRYYGRYVDDFVIVHQDKKYLTSVISIVREYLCDTVSLELHPKKIYLQHFSRGMDFCGVIIKPYRMYIRNKTKGNFYKKINYWIAVLQKNHYIFSKEILDQFLASVNSYLGNMKQYNTYKLRKKIVTNNVLPYFGEHILVTNNYSKVVAKNIEEKKV